MNKSKLIRASDIQFDAELLCPMNGNMFIKVDDVSRVIASIPGVDVVSRDTIEEIKISPATSRFISVEVANKQIIDLLKKIQADFKGCIDGGEGSHDFELGVDTARNQAIEMIEDEINVLRRQCR